MKDWTYISEMTDELCRIFGFDGHYHARMVGQTSHARVVDVVACVPTENEYDRALVVEVRVGADSMGGAIWGVAGYNRLGDDCGRSLLHEVEGLGMGVIWGKAPEVGWTPHRALILGLIESFGYDVSAPHPHCVEKSPRPTP